jgi:hypothetical protein
MLRNLSVAIVIIVYIGGSVCADEKDILPTSFGLEWGRDFNQVRDTYDYSGVKKDSSGNFEILTINTGDFLPSNTDFLQLLVHPDAGLVKFTWFSDNFTSDLYGTSGKEGFDEMVNILNKKYGFQSKKITFSGLELWDEPDEFYQCLKHTGCGAWVAFWGSDNNSNLNEDAAASIELKGLGRAEGYLEFSVEHPDFYRILQNHAQRDADKF